MSTPATRHARGSDRTSRRKSGGKHAAHKQARPGSYRSPACSMHELENEQTREGVCDVRIKRIYDEPARSDGFRVLVDRLWPRGVKKQDARLDAWARELAPSPLLRKWFGHEPKRFPKFRERYRAELEERAVELEALRRRAAHERVTLLYAARDPRINHAAVLEEAIREAPRTRQGA